ncbi:hypothetical protein A2631_01230 [Candidatus Daviesbacteria bacterium RIFCSPHIGHO2_01_FULL_44_29]|uniref:Uncharacterized protein n=1 Tax=Candidatus Daviesbacteria bacterium RIFCSPHIGHO2_02_FULL_43_12 TaxID=1797776 RepID=A0A1F5KIT0_9BACT|nr:MAG: hypothetical protein A2631_01230 [Candidatus Daviesbacteria bacterium RIFCSPHIGHO2_01_FULL_44_29]OGE40359.1 MAG: hypothetical protein A3E86_01085 [Candidatus Daviesbacteria bacterium RIFCSPHIGHO2_12_FULL_47_45]OGE40705.1 MAG: hypothetical protein A3D25_05515 [Candidatus Daviesbacteria bacterium RIFCSPHIGHO2_02_FULL_43_12]
MNNLDTIPGSPQPSAEVPKLTQENIKHPARGILGRALYFAGALRDRIVHFATKPVNPIDGSSSYQRSSVLIPPYLSEPQNPPEATPEQPLRATIKEVTRNLPLFPQG